MADVKRIHEIFDNLAIENKVIVCSRKDWVKLASLIPSEYTGFWCVQDVEVVIQEQEKLIQRIKEHVG